MTIYLSDAGKRYNRDWIFRHFNYQFISGTSYAITGPNGSGKSTLLQCLSGGLMLNEGFMKVNNRYPETSGVSRDPETSGVADENIYKEVSICAPYLELIEEMTLVEFLAFHQTFKSYLPGVTIDFVVTTIDLEKARNKQIRFFSSGMKQRVKLAQCIFSNTPIVLLDEPCTNLDSAGIALYHSLIKQYCGERLVVVSSNDEVEYSFCREVLRMQEIK